MKKILLAAIMLYPIAVLAVKNEVKTEAQQLQEISTLIAARNGGNFKKLSKVLEDKNRKINSDHITLAQKQVNDTKANLKKISKRDAARFVFGALSGFVGVCSLLTGWKMIKEWNDLRFGTDYFMNQDEINKNGKSALMFLGLSIPAWYVAATNLWKSVRLSSREDDHKNARAIQSLLKEREHSK